MERPEALKYFHAAQAEFTTDEIEIDIPSTEAEAEKQISRNDEGAWVRAWVFVSDIEAEDQ